MEELAPVLLLLVWSVLAAIAGAVRNRRMKKNQPGQGTAPDTPGQSLFEQLQEVRRQAQQQILNEMGVETPEQIALRKAEELRRVAEVKAAFEREQAGWSVIEREEHRDEGVFKSTVEEPLPPLPALGSLHAPPRKPSRLAQNLMRDLNSGPESLQRAVLLTEILGAPPGLADPGRAGEPTSRPWC